MLCFCVCPNFNQGPLLKRLTWIFCNFTKTVKKNETMHQVKVWCENQDFIFYCYHFFWILFFFKFILIYFFARISLNKYVYFMLQSAILPFWIFYAYNIALVENWSFWLRLFHPVKCPFTNVLLYFCYIHIQIIRPQSVFNLFFHCLSSMNGGHSK